MTRTKAQQISCKKAEANRRQRVKDDPIYAAKFRARNKKHRQDFAKRHPNRIRAHSIKKGQKHWATRMVNNSKTTDLRKKRPIVIPYYITVEFLKNQFERQNGECAYCVNRMEFGEGKKRTKSLGMTVQRINSEKPHNQDNCILACLKCNLLTRSIPHEVMLEYGGSLRDREEIAYCTSYHHIGNRIVLASDMPNYKHLCRSCTRITKRLDDQKRRSQCQKIIEPCIDISSVT